MIRVLRKAYIKYLLQNSKGFCKCKCMDQKHNGKNWIELKNNWK